MTRTHRGLRYNRCQRNLLEKKFSNRWAKAQENHSFLLQHVLDSKGTSYPPPDVSDRDAVVAATVIQWLGTLVGQDFLREVMGKERLIKLANKER